MHTQDLRDNDRDRRNYYYNKRGWFDRWRWQACLSRSRLKDNPLRFMVTLGSNEDDRSVHLSVAFLGAALYLTFHKLLPEKWAVGWYTRRYVTEKEETVDGVTIPSGTVVEVKNPRWHEDSMGRDWGFYIHDTSFVFHWANTVAVGGSKRKDGLYGYSKFIYFPWSWEHVRNEVLTADGKWVDSSHEARSKAWRKLRATDPNADYFKLKNEDFPDQAEWHTADYTYVRKSGEVQRRTAKFYVEEREWRWKLFYKLPFRFGPKIVCRSIHVDFSDEVGEGTGSWKGGTVGCGHDMRPGETALQCLRRMEKEVKFSR